MSLIHWWPLRDSLNDIVGETPLMSGTASGSYSFNNTGKLGACVSLSSQNLNVANPFIDLNSWSISFWVRDDGVSDWGDIICWYANFSRIEVYGSGSNWYWYNGQPNNGWYDLSTGNVFSSAAITSGLTRNKWHHIVITKSGNNAKLYVNNALKIDQNNATTFTSGSDKMYFNCRAAIGSSSGSLSLSDVKAYDHELSVAEVKELSKGLMVHYTFQNHDNIFNVKEYLKSNVNTGSLSAYGTTGFVFYSTGSDPYTNNYTSYVGSAAGNNVIMFPIKEGKTYTLSWRQVSGVELDKNLYSYYNASKTCVGASAYTFFTMTSKDTWRYTQFTVPTGYGITQMGVRVGSVNLTSGKSTTIDHIMLTTYAGEDYQFHSDNYVIPNEVGYSCDAVLHNGFYSSDTASGTCSCHTPRLLSSSNTGTPSPSNSSYVAGDLGYEFTPEEFSIAFWWKPIDWGYGSGPFAMAKGISDYTEGTLHSHDKDIRINFTDKTCQTVRFTDCPLNQWSHFAVTYKNGIATSYINGQKQPDKTTSTSTLGSWRYIYLGAAGAGGVIRDGDIYWGDFRYYSTCLSGDDVKDLCFTKAYITNKGDVETYQFVENKSQAQVTSKGIFECKEVCEGLDEGYEILEYIESTSGYTQCIDTGYYWTSEVGRLNIDMEITTLGLYQTLFGNEEYVNSGSTRYFTHILHSSNATGTFAAYHGGGSVATVNLPIGQRFYLEYYTTADKKLYIKKDNTTIVNGTAYSGSIQTKNNAYTNSTASTNVGHIFLFSNHNSEKGSTNAGTQHVSSMKVYSCELHDNGKLVRSLRPCRRTSDGAIGMYDTVQKTFHANAGSGTFTAGPTLTTGQASIFEDQRVSGRNIIEI